MTQTRSLFALLFSLSAACAARPPTPTLDAMQDSAMPQDDGPRTFTLTLLSDNLEVAYGERTTLDVRIERSGGFDEPVLIELAGLPDPPCVSQAREARVGDGVITLTIKASPDDDGDAPPIDRAAFVVQASTLGGLRQIAPARISVR